MTRSNWSSWLLGAVVVSLGFGAWAELERFKPPESNAIEVWRVTNDPTVRDWASYHNTQCWSPDGRYMCYTHYAADEKEFGTIEAAEVHVYDFQKGKDIKIDNGTEPRWANNHSWLFYIQSRPQDGPSDGKGTRVMWLDLETQKKKRIAYGVQRLKETDYKDRWLYGLRSIDDGDRKPVRIPIKEDSRPEPLQEAPAFNHSWFSVNPNHPLIVGRDYRYKDHYYAQDPDEEDIPFNARHHFECDLDGSDRTSPYPIMEGSHFSWSGDGSYFLCGNGQMRGRKWDEPLPSNINFLAAITCGDICKGDRSGRWICGSSRSGRGSLRVADLRSGDGWEVLKSHSVICYPGEGDHSTPYDIDAKGSPDGTKITFVSTYDLTNGPWTETTEEFSGDRIVVASTEGFPDKGRLVAVDGFRREVLAYGRKTPTTFEGLERGLYGTPEARFRPNQKVTSFEARLIPEELWKVLPLPAERIREVVGDMESPLNWQRSSDIYVAVVRLPDAPHLHKMLDYVELVPGENHRETNGYHIVKDGQRVTRGPLRPGETFTLPGSGSYAAVAVEWSGLESKASLPLQIEAGMKLKTLADRPADFSWTRDRWLVDGKEVSREVATQAPEFLKETVHIHDRVIHREWYAKGRIVLRHDLNLEGKPIRRLFYENGKLARREYHNRDGVHVSTEHFDPDGYITESIQYDVYGKQGEARRWWYEQGEPVKCIRDRDEGQEIYIRESLAQWVRK